MITPNKPAPDSPDRPISAPASNQQPTITAKPHPRHAEAAAALATSGDDRLVWPEFGNAGDAELVW